ncbi:MAG: O-antigen ligase family protein [Patescibacteria group bacterium]|nr:O-antigen ligase family protein [Patescibacteria group bacterium]
MLAKLTNYLILMFLFLLPWQTRWIYGAAELNGLPWEYGTLSFYGTEILLWAIVILTGMRIFGRPDFWQAITGRAHLARRWPALILGVTIAVLAFYFYQASSVKEVSAQFISRLLGSICLMVCLAAANLNFKQMGLAFWSGGVIQGIIAIGQFFTQEIFANKWFGLAAHQVTDIGAAVVQSADERWLRAYGFFGWPNSLGIYLAVVFVLGLMLFNKINKKYQPLFLGGQMLIIAGLLFSFSRGAWLALVAGLLVYLFINWRKKFSFISPAKQIIAGVIMVAVVMSIYPSLFAVRVGATGYLENLSLNERAAQFNLAEITTLNNIWFGVGPGLYTYYVAMNYSPPLYGVYQPVHNIYLLSLAELGILTFLCFGVLVVWLATRIWKINPLYISVLAVILTGGFFDHFLWSLFAGQILFWTVFGLGLAKNGNGDITTREES